jgi:hypothetical protein
MKLINRILDFIIDHANEAIVVLIIFMAAMLTFAIRHAH